MNRFEEYSTEYYNILEQFNHISRLLNKINIRNKYPKQPKVIR